MQNPLIRVPVNGHDDLENWYVLNNFIAPPRSNVSKPLSATQKCCSYLKKRPLLLTYVLEPNLFDTLCALDFATVISVQRNLRSKKKMQTCF